MKITKNLITVIFLLLGIISLSQEARGWPGKYALSFDENDSSIFYVEVVPDVDDNGALNSQSEVVVMTDSNIEYEVTNILGNWDMNGPIIHPLTCEEQMFDFVLFSNHDMLVEAGVPIRIIKFQAVNSDCAVGTGARLYGLYNFQSAGYDPCESLAGYVDVGLSTSSYSEGGGTHDSEALTGLLNDYTNPLLCLEEEFCFKEANTAGDVLNTEVGISTLGRDAFNGEWPQNRQGAWIALESNEKAFIPTRATTAQIDAITDPVIGMMVYSTDEKCLKINTDGTQAGWHCFTAPACEEDMD